MADIFGRSVLPLGRWTLLLAVGCLPFSASADSKSSALSLDSVARRYGFDSFAMRGRQLEFGKQSPSLRLESNSRKACFDGVTIWLNAPVSKRWLRWTLLRIDIDKTLDPLFFNKKALANVGARTIVIDAGHGGNDNGASGGSSVEKTMNLDIAKRVRDLLWKQNVRAYLTRTLDKTMELEERCAKAGRWHADLFVSIHLNSSDNASASGIETHVMTPMGWPNTGSETVNSLGSVQAPGNRFDSANMVLGYLLQKNLLRCAGGEDRGVRRSRFYVIRNVACPAALVECGFMSNARDLRNLRASAQRNAIAQGITDGIVAYLNAVRKAQPAKP